MSFTGNEDHSIALATASAWTKNYRDKNPGSVNGHYFGKKAIQAIFDQSTCVGMRLYYAMDDSGVKQIIVVGVKADEGDLYNGLLAERSIPCPPLCGGGGNPLSGL